MGFYTKYTLVFHTLSRFYILCNQIRWHYKQKCVIIIMLGLLKSPCFSIFKANPLDFSHQNIYNSQVIQYAGVAELADAPDLGHTTLRKLTCSVTKSAWHTHNYRFCYRHDTWQLLSFYIIAKKFAISSHL